MQAKLTEAKIVLFPMNPHNPHNNVMPCLFRARLSTQPPQSWKSWEAQRSVWDNWWPPPLGCHWAGAAWSPAVRPAGARQGAGLQSPAGVLSLQCPAGVSFKHAVTEQTDKNIRDRWGFIRQMRLYETDEVMWDRWGYFRQVHLVTMGGKEEKNLLT